MCISGFDLFITKYNVFYEYNVRLNGIKQKKKHVRRTE